MHYAAQLKIPILMLAGSQDAWYTREQAERAFSTIASAEKQIVWYDVGHRLPEEDAGAAEYWFRHHFQ
jgi:predicted esterase